MFPQVFWSEHFDSARREPGQVLKILFLIRNKLFPVKPPVSPFVKCLGQGAQRKKQGNFFRGSKEHKVI